MRLQPAPEISRQSDVIELLLSVERVDTIAASRLLAKELLIFRQCRTGDSLQVLRYQRASPPLSHRFPPMQPTPPIALPPARAPVASPSPACPAGSRAFAVSASR